MLRRLFKIVKAQTARLFQLHVMQFIGFYYKKG